MKDEPPETKQTTAMRTLFESNELQAVLRVKYLVQDGDGIYYLRKGRRRQVVQVSGNRYTLAPELLQKEEQSERLPVSHRKKIKILFEVVRRVAEALGLKAVPYQDFGDGASQTQRQVEEPYPVFPEYFVRPSSEAADYHLSDQMRNSLTTVARLVEEGEKEVILITGPTGTGKTTLAEHFAFKLNRPLFIVDCGAYNDALNFFGAKDLAMKEGRQVIEWVEHEFVTAVETEKAVVVLDEANRLHPTYLNALFPLFDHRGRIFIPGMARPVMVAPGVTFFVTMNLGSAYTGTYQADSAFLDRMTRHLETNYLDPEQEKRLVVERTGLPTLHAERLTKLAARIRELAAREDPLIRMGISTRQILKTAEYMLRDRLNLEKAVRSTFLNNYSSEGGASSERATVLQAIQAVG